MTQEEMTQQFNTTYDHLCKLLATIHIQTQIQYPTCQVRERVSHSMHRVHHAVHEVKPPTAPTQLLRQQHRHHCIHTTAYTIQYLRSKMLHTEDSDTTGYLYSTAGLSSTYSTHIYVQ